MHLIDPGLQSGGMGRANVLILTALSIEASYVAKAMGMKPPTPGRPTTGFLSDVRIELAIVGVRAKHLPSVELHLPDYVILAGFAGGLSPELKVGDVVIDCEGLPSELPLTCKQGRIHCSDRAVNSVYEKRSLFSCSRCLAVDMESVTIGEWAGQAGLPLVMIRAISDSAEDALDGQLLNLIDEFGAPRFRRLLPALLARPSLVPSLFKLGRASRVAGDNLGRAVREFLELNRDRAVERNPSDA